MDTIKQDISKETDIPKEQPTNTPVAADPDRLSVNDLWGDIRYSPIFLGVAEFFNIDQKTYAQSASKIAAIVDWAVEETGSKNIADILSKISEASRSLQSPGFGEHRYAILYRYIKLARQKTQLEKQMGAYKK